MAEQGNLSRIFGGGGGSDGTAPEGGPSGDTDLAELGGDLAELGEDDMAEEADAMPPDFALNASEAFPELAGDDGRLEALYRTIKSCHPVV